MNKIFAFFKKHQDGIKQFTKYALSSLFTSLKFALLITLITILIVLIVRGINFSIPAVKSFISAQETTPTIFETVLNNANFAIVFISILFTIIGVLVTLLSTWWYKSLKRLERCHQDYEKFNEKAPLQTLLTTAKIFFIQNDLAEAWDYIKDLPDDLSFEVPLYKARILLKQSHKNSVFFTVIKFLNKALSLPRLTKEAKAMIYKFISDAYLDEKKDYEKALEFAEKAINETPVYWPAHIAKGRTLKRIEPDRLNEAINILERVIGEDKTYETAYYNLACYYSLKSKRETDQRKQAELKNTAIKYYKISIELNPKNKKLAQTDTDLEFIRGVLEIYDF